MRTVNLGLGERRRLHQVAEAIYARLIAKSSRFQPEINARENGAVSLITVGLLVIGFLAGAAAGYLHADRLVAVTGLDALAGPLGPVASGVPAAILAYLVLGRIGRAFSGKPLFQQMAELYIFNAKFTAPTRRLEMVEAALRWLERQPEMTFEATAFLYGTERGRDVLPPRVGAAVDALSGNGCRAVCLRNFFERKLKSEYVAHRLMSDRNELSYRRRYFIQSRGARNGIRASLLLNALGCELRDEIKTGTQWRRQRYTDHERQITTIRDNADLTLRYRTGAPHYRWPNEREEKSDGETAPYLLFAPIENPAQIPLHIITVDHVMARLPQAVRWQLEDEELSESDIAAEIDSVIRLLSETDVEMFGKWDDKTLRQRSEVALLPQPVLKNLSGDPENPDWGLRWDPNRIDWSQFLVTDGAIRRAFAALLKAIDLADADAEKIRLRRGDALLVDNLRAMVRRRELGPDGVAYWRAVADYPEAWWFNVYYGFRKSKRPEFLGL